MSSFDEAILQEPDRFIGYAFGHNDKISNFGEFKNALNSGIDHAKGHIDEQTVINLFERPETKRKIKENVTQDEYEDLYGDGNIVQREAVSPTKAVVVVTPKVKVANHNRGGKVVKNYNRGFRKWSPAEAKFLQVRKQRGLTPKQTIREFNAHFEDTPRSQSSIKTKIYRL